MGRRTPNNIHELNGTFRKDRHSSTGDGLQIDSSYPEAPSYLADGPLEIWAAVRGVMESTKLYTQADASKIARYCVLENEFRTTLEDYPATKLAQLRLLERDLYLDPEARQKLGIAKAKTGNPFDKFT